MRFPLAWRGQYMFGEVITDDNRILDLGAGIPFDGVSIGLAYYLDYNIGRDAWIMHKLAKLPGTPPAKLMALHMFHGGEL